MTRPPALACWHYAYMSLVCLQLAYLPWSGLSLLSVCLPDYHLTYPLPVLQGVHQQTCQHQQLQRKQLFRHHLQG